MLPNTEVFDGTTGHWSAAASLTVPRAACAVSSLGTGDNRILVAGGWGGDDDGGTGGLSLPSIEVFDPALQRWQLLEGLALRQPRRGLRAAVTVGLHGEPMVLLMGGETDTGECVRTVEAIHMQPSPGQESVGAAHSLSSIGSAFGSGPRGNAAGLAWACAPRGRRASASLSDESSSGSDGNTRTLRNRLSAESGSGGGGGEAGLLDNKVLFFHEDGAPSPIKAEGSADTALAQPTPVIPTIDESEGGGKAPSTTPSVDNAGPAATVVPSLALGNVPMSGERYEQVDGGASSASLSVSSNDDDDEGDRGSDGSTRALPGTTSWSLSRAQNMYERAPLTVS
eukprot:COSAG05_NODE_147_length_16383_cov_266.102555_25_plen_340_part_00